MDKLSFNIGDTPIQSNFDQLVKDRDALNNADAALDARLDALEALGLTKRTRGTANVSTSAAVSGNLTGVAHGLGTTPNQVQATAQNSASGLTAVSVSNVGATTFDIGIRFVDGVARTTTIVVGWEAIA